MVPVALQVILSCFAVWALCAYVCRPHVCSTDHTNMRICQVRPIEYTCYMAVYDLHTDHLGIKLSPCKLLPEGQQHAKILQRSPANYASPRMEAVPEQGGDLGIASALRVLVAFQDPALVLLVGACVMQVETLLDLSKYVQSIEACT